MSQTINIAVLGASGRMGQAVICEIDRRADCALSGAIVARTSRALGRDAGKQAGCEPNNIIISDDLDMALNSCDVLIDFSAPDGAIDAALKMHDVSCRAMVTGTTGFSKTEEQALMKAADSVALLKSGNFSLGVNLLAGLVEQAARKLKDDWDIEIFEMHHNQKVDAPSGTALLLGEAAAEGRDMDLDDHAVLARKGVGNARKRGEIGFAALRGGGIIGDHDVRFVSDMEMLTLSHRALDRRLFAAGAVEAAVWAAGQKKGFYDMKDVLGL